MNAKSLFRPALLLAFVGLTVGTIANAQDDKKKKRQGRGVGVAKQLMGRFKNIEFSDEQKKKVAEIAKKYAGDVAELRKASTGSLTGEQRKARAEALRAARKDGKKFAEAAAAANKAAGLSEEVVAKMNKAQSEMQALLKKMSAEVQALLTDEQKAAQRKARGKNARGKGKKEEKKDGDTAKKTEGITVSLKLPNMT